MKNKEFEKLTYEEAIALLEATVTKLENGELTLDNSMEAFNDGVELIRLCEKKLSEFEGKISILVESSAPDDTQVEQNEDLE